MSEYVTVSPYSKGLDASGRTLDELFPEIDPEFKPYGHRVLLQVRRVFEKSKGGIVLAETTQETEQWNMQVAKLIAVGPLAFKRRDTGEAWPEGVWASIGDFVRIPRWGGDRWSVDMNDGGKPVTVVLLADSDLLGKHEGDPAGIKAYLA